MSSKSTSFVANDRPHRLRDRFPSVAIRPTTYARSAVHSAPRSNHAGWTRPVPGSGPLRLARNARSLNRRAMVVGDTPNFPATCVIVNLWVT